MNDDDRSLKLSASNEELLVFYNSNSLPWTFGILVVDPDQAIFGDHCLEHHHYCSALSNLRLALGETLWPSRRSGNRDYGFQLFRHDGSSYVAGHQLG